jgi:hypothetical protein
MLLDAQETDSGTQFTGQPDTHPMPPLARIAALFVVNGKALSFYPNVQARLLVFAVPVVNLNAAMMQVLTTTARTLKGIRATP